MTHEQERKIFLDSLMGNMQARLAIEYKRGVDDAAGVNVIALQGAIKRLEVENTNLAKANADAYNRGRGYATKEFKTKLDELISDLEVYGL